MDSIPEKRCNKCKNFYPPTHEYWYKSKYQSSGLSTYCKTCERARSRDYHHRNPEKVKAAKKDWIEKNRDKHLAIKKRHYFKYHDKHMARMDKYYEEHSQDFIDRVKQWREDNPEKYAIQSAVQFNKRRARKQALPDTFTNDDWLHALEYFGNCCAVCGRPKGLWHKLSADHWIPITSPNCTGTIPSNIVPLCHGIDGCNNKKNKQHPDEWLIKTFGKRKAKKIAKRIQDYFSSL